MAINTNYTNIYSSILSPVSAYNTYNKLYSLFNEKYNNGYGSNNSNSISSENKKYLSCIKEDSSNLKSSLDSLLGKSGYKSSFNKKAIVSSDSESLTVQTDNAWSFTDKTVNISQVACGQTNEGTALASDARIGSYNYYEFEITTGGKTHKLFFNVSENNTNLDMQDKMAKAINDAKIGVTACVDKNGKTSVLKLTSDNTGDDIKNTIKIKDLIGDAVSKTGAANATQEAQDAFYSIDGGELQTSRSNVINLGGGVTATLKKASDKEITVSLKESGAQSGSDIRDMVDSFNSLLYTSAENKNDSGASKLCNQLSTLSKSYSRSLTKLGIEVSDQGYMQINEKNFASALENGSLNKFFTNNPDKSYGFANRLSTLAGSVSKNPISYISNQAIKLPATLSSFYSPDQMTNDNRLFGSGLLIDCFI